MRIHLSIDTLKVLVVFYALSLRLTSSIPCDDIIVKDSTASECLCNELDYYQSSLNTCVALCNETSIANSVTRVCEQVKSCSLTFQ